MNIQFKEWQCKANLTRYASGAPAITLTDANTGEPIAKASVYFPEVPLAEDEVAIKDYAENEGILAALIEAGVVIPTGKAIDSGFVYAPICVMTPKFLEQAA